MGEEGVVDCPDAAASCEATSTGAETVAVGCVGAANTCEAASTGAGEPPANRTGCGTAPPCIIGAPTGCDDTAGRDGAPAEPPAGGIAPADAEAAAGGGGGGTCAALA